MTELMQCPFCRAGETIISSENSHWTGRGSTVISVEVRHWCERPDGQPQSTITIKGKTRDDAIAAWNRRP